MPQPAVERVVLAGVLLLACAAFGPGCNWGLPSRAVDPYLFGSQPPWPGSKINELAPSDANVPGADVDANPIADRSKPIVLNDSDPARAEIIRRYRLFSAQPDEMITFKSLSRIRQHRGDPRLYQYGGLWIYPVGALIKVTLNPKSDSVYYLDHPEAFGSFYVVARLYSAAWGLVAVWAMFRIVRRMTGKLPIAALAAVSFAFMPVVVTGAHEAKPHLAGLALTLLAVLAAANYVESARARWAILAGVLCGAAWGMVLTGVMAFAVLAVMVLRRRDRAGVRILQAAGMGVLTYLVFNPFVAIHLFHDREVLRSNMGNTAAMYAISFGGIVNAVRLIVEGASPVVAIAGVIGLAVLALRNRDNPTEQRCGVGWLLAGPAGVVLIQFVLLATDKPPEYARFGLLPDAFLLVAAFAAIARITTASARTTLAIAVTGLAVTFGVLYVCAFVRDARPVTSRLAAAEQLKRLADQGATTIAVPAEPAPYCMPPVDLFRTRLVLVPRGQPAPTETIVSLDEAHSPAPISWADVRYFITRRPTTPAVSSPP